MPLGYGKKKKKMSTEAFHSKPSIVDVIKSSEQHTILHSLLKKTKLNDVLKASDKITVFAPTDKALKGAENMPVADLKTILLGHVLQYSTSPPPNHKNMKSFKSLSGTRIDATKVRRFMNKGIKTTNGTLYITDAIIS